MIQAESNLIWSMFQIKSYFRKVHEKEVKREIKNSNSKKATCHRAIPAKTLKQFCDLYLTIIIKMINKSITEGTFPSELKLAELDCMNKENYRPISLLSHMSKVFERILLNQLNNFIKYKLSNIFTGFRKDHSAQTLIVNHD